MISVFQPARTRSWLKQNAAAVGLGIVIGLLITTSVAALNNEWPSASRLFITIFFSTMISLFITNALYVLATFRRQKKSMGIGFLLLYYGVSLLAMFLAIEVTYLLAHWIFGWEYAFMFHITEMKFNSIIVLIVCTALYIYFSMKDRQEALLKEKELDAVRLNKLRTEAELASLQSRINPHFLYNALNSLASLISSAPEKAEEMTIKLAALFRYSVNHGDEHLSSVSDEVAIVKTYLDIEQIRFGARIIFEILVDKDIKTAKIPRFLVQPLVENALKHGLKDTLSEGSLTVSISRQADRLEISVSDNGHPFPTNLNPGYGLQSTYEKLDLLYPQDYEVRLLNEPEKQININLPFQL